MNTAPLTPEERRDILAVLGKAVRDVYPELQLPYLEAVRACRHPLEPAALEGRLPAEVEAAVGRDDSGMGVDLARRLHLRAYLFENPGRNAQALRWLEERVEPVLRRCSRIEPDSFALLWGNLLPGDAPTEILWYLVEQFTDQGRDGRGGPFVDTFLYFYQIQCLCSRTLRPGERWAVRQILNLAAANLSAEPLRSSLCTFLGEALRLGSHDLAATFLGAISSAPSGEEGTDGRFDAADALVNHLEGVLLFLGGYLSMYLDAVEDLEGRFFSQVALFRAERPDSEGMTPSLHDLRRIAEYNPAEDDGRRQYIAASTAVEFAHRFVHRYRPARLLVPILLYVDSNFYGSPDSRRLMNLVDRGFAYWRLRDVRHRYAYGDPPFRPAEWDHIAREELLRDVVELWHAHREQPVVLLRRCRSLLRDSSALQWARKASQDRTGLAAYLTILPLWLLEVRALRLFGRGSREWREADRLAVSRFSRIAYPELMDNFRDDSPGRVLLAMEALRQLAVALNAVPPADAFWKLEPLRCARELLLHLETFADAAVRRLISGFLRPIFTALAGQLAADPATAGDGFCLFEQARSRWLLDHLAPGERTLVVAADDSDATRSLKERLFDVLNPVAAPGERIALRQIPDALWRDLQLAAPDLARLVAACWPDRDRVFAALPAQAALLACHVEDDPAEPPLIRLDGSSAPWPAEPPGPNARLFTFYVRSAACWAHVCPRPAADVLRQVRLLQSIGQSAQRLVANRRVVDWNDALLRERYERVLTDLAGDLVRPWEDAWPRESFPLLILPCGELFQLPWPALPLHRGGRLIDAVVSGLLPGLGPALWLNTDPDHDRPVGRAEVFLRRAPDVPGGLELPTNFVSRLRREPLRLVEGSHATPERVSKAFRESECVIFLCHGYGEDRPGLELARTAEHPTGRLTIADLARMGPAERTRVVVLGACWSGLEAAHAAEDVEGLTGVLFLNGVRAVLAGTGWVPVPLVEVCVDAVVRCLQDERTSAGLAQELRRALLGFRDHLEKASVTASACWSSFLFHGVPWSIA